MKKQRRNELISFAIILCLTVLLVVLIRYERSNASDDIPSKNLLEKVMVISKSYDVDPNLILSIMYHESSFNPKSYNGICIGLMQIYKKYHLDRAQRLGVKDFYDIDNNIRLGVDYINELQKQYKDERLVLMMYNMNNKTAKNLYKKGKITKYAKSVIKRKDYYANGGIVWKDRPLEERPPQKQLKLENNNLLGWLSTWRKNNFPMEQLVVKLFLIT